MHADAYACTHTSTKMHNIHMKQYTRAKRIETNQCPCPMLLAAVIIILVPS